MKLYLVQHADAVSKDTHPLRPLSAQGQKDAVKMAAFLQEAEIMVGRVVHSGKLRAEETANALSKTVWHGKMPSVVDGIDPKDSTDGLYGAAQASDVDLMVVGHMPFMGAMASRCLKGGEVMFEPGSVLCLERKGDGWVLDWFVKPAMLEDV